MHSRNIVLVEDSPDDAFLLREAFSEVNPSLHLRCFTSGLSLLEALPGEPLPGIILLDLEIPGMGGLEVLEHLMANPGYKEIPVIVFSATSDPVKISQCYVSGASSFVQKPLNYDELLHLARTIDMLLEKKTSTRP
jgi:CheY-like chemotaxis protein